MKKHIVIDQNVFRKKHLINPAIEDACKTGENIIIADIAFSEMMKTREWETTARASLKLLSENIDIVRVSHSFGLLMRTEKETGEPCLDIIDHQLTIPIQNFIRDIVRGSGHTLNHVNNSISGAQKLAKQQHFNHKKNKMTITRIVDAFKSDLSENELKKFRSGDDDFITDMLSSASITKTIVNILISNGYEKKIAIRLAITPSVSAHNFLCLACYGVRWLDSIHSAKKEKVTNDLADLDYIVTSTFCRRLVSEEQLVNDISSRLETIIKKRCQIIAEHNLNV